MNTVRKKGGFDGSDRHRIICAKGGKTAHEMGRAFEFAAGAEHTAAAGRKGGAAVVAKLGKEHMAEMGRKGAAASVAARRAKREAASARLVEEESAMRQMGLGEKPDSARN